MKGLPRKEIKKTQNLGVKTFDFVFDAISKRAAEMNISQAKIVEIAIISYLNTPELTRLYLQNSGLTK